jgi:DNA polymerase-3 subunit alpha
MDKELLTKYHEGIIATSGCLGGEVAQCVLSRQIRRRERRTRWNGRKIFGKGNYFIEIQKHANVPDCEKIWKDTIRLSKETGIPLVATQDSHYPRSGRRGVPRYPSRGANRHQLDDKDRLTLKDDDFSIASPETMAERFKEVPEAVENTVKIGERCNVDLELGKVLLPNFPKPDGKTANAYMRELVEERIAGRYPGEALTQEVRDRVEYEMGVIEKTGFADYFLIVQDLINWAKDHGIAVGPGRGSAAGSIISYILGITDIDPLTYGLLFERFLNPERIQMPDIDMDFADTRRDEVLAYAKERYGEDHVAQIITFGTMAARAAVRDAGRAMGISYALCDQVAKLIPPMKDWMKPWRKRRNSGRSSKRIRT